MSRRLYRFYLLHSRIKKRIYTKMGYAGRLFVLFGALSFLFGMDTRSTMMYQLASLLVTLVIISFCLSFFFPPNLRVRRILPATCTAGDSLHYVLELTNDGKKQDSGLIFREQSGAKYPSYQEFQASREFVETDRNFVDRKFGYYRWTWLLSHRSGVNFESFSLPEVGAKETIQVRVHLEPLRRGYVRLAGYSVHRPDLLGLFKNEKFYKDPEQLLVLPKLYTVVQRDLKGSRKYHRGGFATVASTGEMGEFVSLREYRSGDPVKNIDWKVTARAGSPVVRQYQDEYFSRNGILLDTFTEYDDQVFEDAVSVAASLVAGQDTARDLIDLLFACDNCISSVAMGPGQSDKLHILEILACIAPCKSKDFAQLAKLVMEHTTVLSGLFLVLVTLDEERKQLIDYLLRMKIPHKVILVTKGREKSEKLLSSFPTQNISLFDVESTTKLVNVS